MDSRAGRPLHNRHSRAGRPLLFPRRRTFAQPSFPRRETLAQPSFPRRRTFAQPSFPCRKTFAQPLFPRRRTFAQPSFPRRRTFAQPLFPRRRTFAQPLFPRRRESKSPLGMLAISARWGICAGRNCSELLRETRPIPGGFLLAGTTVLWLSKSGFGAGPSPHYPFTLSSPTLRRGVSKGAHNSACGWGRHTHWRQGCGRRSIRAG